MSGSAVNIYAVGELRVWRLVLPAPCELLSVNAEHKMNPHKVAKIRKTWRDTTYELLRDNRMPKGLARLDFALVFHFTTAARRDSLNYSSTAKPIVDAFGPPFIQAPTPKKPGGASAPGWGMIPDDSPREVEATTLKIGPLWQDIITDPRHRLTYADVNALDHGWGGVTIVVRECEPLPPEPARKRVPIKDVIPPDVRRRLAMTILNGAACGATFEDNR